MKEITLSNVVIGQTIVIAAAFIGMRIQKKLKRDDDIYTLFVFTVLTLYTAFNMFYLICLVFQG